MEESIKELQLEVAQLKESLNMSIKLNENLIGTVDGLRNQINSMNSINIVSEEDKMKDEVMKGFGLI